MLAVAAFALAVALQAAGPRPLNAESWITAGDYPDAARRHDEEGVVSFQLRVDADGRVSDCNIVRSSGSAALDDQTCSLIRSRAQFEPARDAQRNVVAGTYRQSVQWQLPAATTQPVTTWAAVSRAVISGDGALMSCTDTNLGPVRDSNWGSFCQSAGGTIPEILLAFRGGPGEASATVIHEAHFSVDGIATYPRRHDQPGHRLISLIESQFDITADGRTGNCTIVRREGLEMLHGQLCDHMFEGPYQVVDGRPHTVRVLIALSVETAEAPQAQR